MSDLIERQAATQTALEFIVEYLGGAFDEDFQKELIERMNALPSAQPDLSEYSDKLWRSAYERGKRDAQPDISEGHKRRWDKIRAERRKE